MLSLSTRCKKSAKKEHNRSKFTYEIKNKKFQFFFGRTSWETDRETRRKILNTKCHKKWRKMGKQNYRPKDHIRIIRQKIRIVSSVCRSMYLLLIQCFCLLYNNKIPKKKNLRWKSWICWFCAYFQSKPEKKRKWNSANEKLSAFLALM